MSRVRRLTTSHPQGSYDIVVGPGALAAARGFLESWSADRRVFVVSSEPVLALHGKALIPLLSSAADVVQLVVADGEAAKTLDEAGRLWRDMLKAGGKRDSRLVALGGGSVGDLGGFAAACFLRGIEVVQVPTTLLAQVDASVGGKTAIDLPAGKNTVGAFWQPSLVVADSDVLRTLPGAEVNAGLAEVVKMAATLDLELFEEVERSIDELKKADSRRLAPVIAGAIEAKRRVVEEDPHEHDRRRLLNFGHTLGHAIEAALGYGSMRHGEAIGWGMLFALRLAERRGLDEASSKRIAAVVRMLELPPLPPLAASDLLVAMRRDKKASEAGLAWVIPLRIGEARVVDDLPWSEVERELAAFLTESR
jgi:3-dehydroquinate synthase